MKKTLISIVAVAFVALMISNTYANCSCRPPGFTPGFWKHNIRVYLGLTNGKYNAFEGGDLDGVKLTDALMDGYLAAINALLDPDAPYIFEEALENLELPGWHWLRTYTANMFNWAAGYGPFED